MATKTAKSKSTKTKATKAKSNGQKVTFTDDIPAVTRQGGGNRSSKYDELLEQLVEARTTKRKTPTARMEFDSVGKSTSRYQSIKSAIEKREDSHLFVVAQRDESDEDAEVRAVYVKYDPTLPESDEDESVDPEDVEDDEDEDDEDVDF